MEERITGVVKWFNSAKGYGFISPNDGGDDIFVHFSGIAGKGRRDLEDGQKVEYEVQQTARGLQAINVS